jgi:hypothetical protein
VDLDPAPKKVSLGDAMLFQPAVKPIIAQWILISSFTRNPPSLTNRLSSCRRHQIWFLSESYHDICCSLWTDISLEK